MSEFSKALIESIMASKPVDAQKLFAEAIAEKIEVALPQVMGMFVESAFGPEDGEEGEDTYTEIDFDEMTDEEFASLLDQLSDADFEDLADALGDAELDEEAIMEISKARLGDYVKKASHDVAARSAAVGRHGDRAQRVSDEMKNGKYDNFTQGKKDSDTADKHFQKSWKRRAGMAKAVDKLTKEEVEQVDEISKERVAKYVVKSVGDREKQRTGFNKANKDGNTASNNLRRANNDGPDHDYGETDATHADRVNNLKKRVAKFGAAEKSHDRKFKARNNGLSMAGRRLNREEVEQVDEISNARKADYVAKATDHIDRAKKNVAARMQRHGSITTKDKVDSDRADQHKPFVKKILAKANLIKSKV